MEIIPLFSTSSLNWPISFNLQGKVRLRRKQIYFFQKSLNGKLYIRTYEHVALAWKVIQHEGGKDTLSTTCYLRTLQALRGTITIARATMRMQMSQCALIWICVSAISLNNNHRITITRDLRDLTGEYADNKKSLSRILWILCAVNCPDAFKKFKNF